MVPYNETGRKLHTAFHLSLPIREKTNISNAAHPGFLGNDASGHLASKVPGDIECRIYREIRLESPFISCDENVNDTDVNMKLYNKFTQSIIRYMSQRYAKAVVFDFLIF